MQPGWGSAEGRAPNQTNLRMASSFFGWAPIRPRLAPCRHEMTIPEKKRFIALGNEGAWKGGFLGKPTRGPKKPFFKSPFFI